MLKLDKIIMPPSGGNFRYYIQPPAEFVFSPTNSSLSDMKIASPSQAWISLFKDGGFYLTGQMQVKEKENTTTSTTQILNIDGFGKFNRVYHNKLNGMTSYHNITGLLSIGHIDWSNVTYSVKTFDNGTGVFYIIGESR